MPAELRTVEWTAAGVRFIDQTRLPGEFVQETTTDWQRLVHAIQRLEIRGAPAIGVAGAMAVALAARDLDGPGGLVTLEERAAVIRAARPTAVNLAWGVDRALAEARGAPAGERAAFLGMLAAALAEADVQACRDLGAQGATLLPDDVTVLTHCNAGALATVGYGTALGVLRAAREAGKQVRVFAGETRPVLQGARLTAWELLRDGFDVTLLADTMAGAALRSGTIDAVIVGADRVAANGDVANKIGTYQLAVLARENGVPFYVAAPVSSVDLATPSGDAIVIEERDPEEVTHHGGRRLAPEGVGVWNPAFDVTPARYVSAIVTERGIARPPFGPALRGLVEPASEEWI